MSDPMGNQAGNWIPLMDYAMKKGVSLSTLRRYIKANKIRYRVENGRYLLPVDLNLSSETKPAANLNDSAGEPASPEMQLLLQKMSGELKRAREEVAELKTLVAFYESKLHM
jgi:hypothetical protein